MVGKLAPGFEKPPSMAFGMIRLEVSARIVSKPPNRLSRSKRSVSSGRAYSTLSRSLPVLESGSSSSRLRCPFRRCTGSCRECPNADTVHAIRASLPNLLGNPEDWMLNPLCVQQSRETNIGNNMRVEGTGCTNANTTLPTTDSRRHLSTFAALLANARCCWRTPVTSSLYFAILSLTPHFLAMSFAVDPLRISIRSSSLGSSRQPVSS